jgi:hypothetical protein
MFACGVGLSRSWIDIATADVAFARVLSTTFVAVAVGIFALAAASGLIGSVAAGDGIAVAAAVVTAGLWWKHPPAAFLARQRSLLLSRPSPWSQPSWPWSR